MQRSTPKRKRNATGRRSSVETWLIGPGSSLLLMAPNREPALFALEGFLEAVPSGARSSISIVNLTARLAQPAPKNVPDFFHFQLPERVSKRTIIPWTSRNLPAAVALSISYTDQAPPVYIFDPPRRRKADRIKPPAPLTTIFHVHSGPNPSRSLVLTARDLRLPQWRLTNASIIIFANLAVVKGKLCGEVCLDIKVSSPKGKPVISKANVKKMVDHANAIWGCGPKNTGGPCCIKFTAEDPDEIADIPDSLTLPNEDSTEAQKTAAKIKIDKMLKRKRSETCWNVILIESIESVDETIGFTKTHAGGNKVTGSIVQTPGGGAGGAGKTVKDFGETLAHEMGHAMGLANFGKGTEPDGVTKHSGKKDNLMAPNAGANVNQKQCDKARSSDLVKPTKDVCACAPTET